MSIFYNTNNSYIIFILREKIDYNIITIISIILYE